jgi:hypothetical protein
MFEQNSIWEPEFAHDRSGKKRRSRVRYSTHVSAIFCHTVTEPFDDSCWEEAAVDNVSGQGIGLVVPEPVESDSYLALLVDGIVRLLLARVIHVTPQSEGAWLVGCELVSRLKDEELHILV